MSTLPMDAVPGGAAPFSRGVSPAHASPRGSVVGSTGCPRVVTVDLGALVERAQAVVEQVFTLLVLGLMAVAAVVIAVTVLGVMGGFIG